MYALKPRRSPLIQESEKMFNSSMRNIKRGHRNPLDHLNIIRKRTKSLVCPPVSQPVLNVPVTYFVQAYHLTEKFVNKRTNGPVNAHLISWPSKAQNIQNLENIW